MKKLIILLFIAVMLISCSQKESGANSLQKNNIKDRKKPLAWGKRQSIYTFADADVWKYAESRTRQTLERTVYTTVNEKMFNIEKAEYNKIEDYFRFNNIIFYCDWESEDPVSKYVKEVLSGQIEAKLQADGAAIFPVYNLWADDQMVLFIVGENEENLLKINILQADKVWEIFRDRLYKRIEYLTYRDRIKPKSNFANKSWELDLPANYILFKEDTNFTSWLARSSSKPDRFIAVYHEAAKAEDLSSKWLIAKRNELAGLYYEGDKFTDRDISIMKKIIAGYEGWMIRGRWQNEISSVGGAFSAFAFYEPVKEEIFLIDNAVYYPEGDKLPALIELEVISNSLKIKP